MNRDRTLAVGPMLPPPPGKGRNPLQGKRSSTAAGWLVVASLPSKQSSPAEGAASARSARPLLRTTLPRTSLPPEGQKFVSTIGIIAIPYVA